MVEIIVIFIITFADIFRVVNIIVIRIIICASHSASSSLQQSKINHDYATKSSYAFSCFTSAPAVTSASTDNRSPLPAAACSALFPLQVARQLVASSYRTAMSLARYLLSVAAGLAPASIKNCKHARVTPLSSLPFMYVTIQRLHCVPEGRPVPSHQQLLRISAARRQLLPSTRCR